MYQLDKRDLRLWSIQPQTDHAFNLYNYNARNQEFHQTVALWHACVSEVQWPEISSPCQRCRCKSVSCRRPRKRKEGGLWSAPTCSPGGPPHLSRKWTEREWRRDFCHWLKEGVKKQLCVRKTGWWLDYQKETRVPIKQQWTEPRRQAGTRIRKVWQSADSVWLVRPALLSRSSRWRSSAGSLWPWAPAAWPAEPCPEERQHTARSLLLPAVAFLTEGFRSFLLDTVAVK